MYDANLVNERLHLWEELRQVSSDDPWLILGDFNATLVEEERRGSRSVSGPNQGLVQCVRDLGLNNLQSTGCFYTWINRRSGRYAIAAKIDRVLANSGWMSRFPTSKAHFLELILSDHCCLEVTISDSTHSRPKPFRFFNCWTEHKDYLGILQRV